MKYLFIFSLLFFLISCETDVTNDVTLNGAPPKLVINGGIERNQTTPKTSHIIELTTTINFLDQNEPTAVENATVTVNNGTEDFEFSHQGDGQYVNSEITATLGTTYTVTIQWNNDTYQASDTLIEAPSFDNIYSVFEEETLFTDQGYFVNFDATDPPNIDNYYYYRVFLNDVFTIVPDGGNSTTLIENDQFFDGQARTGVNPNEEVVFEIGDNATVQLLGITENYYNFLFQIFEQTGSSGFSPVGNPPPASVRGNLLNITNPKVRGLGYFYASDVTEASIIISE